MPGAAAAGVPGKMKKFGGAGGFAAAPQIPTPRYKGMGFVEILQSAIAGEKQRGESPGGKSLADSEADSEDPTMRSPMRGSPGGPPGARPGAGGGGSNAGDQADDERVRALEKAVIHYKKKHKHVEKEHKKVLYENMSLHDKSRRLTTEHREMSGTHYSSQQQLQGTAQRLKEVESKYEALKRSSAMDAKALTRALSVKDEIVERLVRPRVSRPNSAAALSRSASAPRMVPAGLEKAARPGTAPPGGKPSPAGGLSTAGSPRGGGGGGDATGGAGMKIASEATIATPGEPRVDRLEGPDRLRLPGRGTRGGDASEIADQPGRDILAECKLLNRDARLQHGYHKEVLLAQAKLKRVEQDYAAATLEIKGLRDDLRRRTAEMDLLKKDNALLKTEIKNLQERQANEAKVLGTRNSVIETIRVEAARDRVAKEEMEAQLASYKEQMEAQVASLRKQLIDSQTDCARLVRRVEETEKLGVASQLEAQLLNDWRAKSSAMFAERNEYVEGKLRKLQTVNKRLSTQIQQTNENVGAYILNTQAGMAQLRGQHAPDRK